MRKRSSTLLLNFLQPSRAISAIKIAENYQISLRTLKSDLIEINDFLSSINESLFNINDLGNIQNDGIIDIAKIKNKLYGLSNYTYRCNQIERQLLIFAMLINHNDYISMGSLAEKIFVSRITILSDIELLKDTLLNHSNIILVSKSSKGIKLDIKDELSLRYLLIDLFRNIIIKIDNENVFLHILERELEIETSLMQIALFLKKYETEHHILFSDESFYEFVLYLYISVYRYQKKYYLANSIDNTILSSITNSKILSIIESKLIALNIIFSKQVSPTM